MQITCTIIQYANIKISYLSFTDKFDEGITEEKVDEILFACDSKHVSEFTFYYTYFSNRLPS
jgi:hypothetical protein